MDNGYVIRTNDDNILKKAMMMEVNGKRKRGRPKLTWRRQVKESVKKVGLKIEEAADQTRWKNISIQQYKKPNNQNNLITSKKRTQVRTDQ